LKLCTRCNTVHDTRSWESLKLVGPQDFGFSVLELRNCTCGTTLAVEMRLTFVLRYELSAPYPCREEFTDMYEANERAADLGGDCIMSRIVQHPAWCGCTEFGPFLAECEGCAA
jgi:hypothetical protein